MKTVWKFELPVDDQVEIKMPEGAKILYIATQHDIPHIWALVDDELTFVRHRFYIHGTGHTIREAAELPYLGSFMMFGGAFVGHVWDGGEA